MANVMDVYRDAPHYKAITAAWSANELDRKTLFAFILADPL